MPRLRRLSLTAWVALLFVLLLANVHRYIEYTWVCDSTQSPMAVSITLFLGLLLLVSSMRRVLRGRPLGPLLTVLVAVIPAYFLLRFLFAGPRAALPLGLCVVALLANAFLLRALNPPAPLTPHTNSAGAVG